MGQAKARGQASLTRTGSFSRVERSGRTVDSSSRHSSHTRLAVSRPDTTRPYATVPVIHESSAQDKKRRIS